MRLVISPERGVTRRRLSVEVRRVSREHPRKLVDLAPKCPDRFGVNAATAQLPLRREQRLPRIPELLEEGICCVFRKPGFATSHAADPIAPYRVPGTPNYPSASKISRGRVVTPTRVLKIGGPVSGSKMVVVVGARLLARDYARTTKMREFFLSYG
jgi:hypothetical protein